MEVFPIVLWLGTTFAIRMVEQCITAGVEMLVVTVDSVDRLSRRCWCHDD